jgi:hypothetical protein
MEEPPENGKEWSHSAHGVEWMNERNILMTNELVIES